MTTTTSMLTGYAAIEYVAAHGGDLGKFADPIEDAIYPLSLASARDIAREDPSLIYWISDEAIDTLRGEAGESGDLDHVAICDAARRGDAQSRAICAEVINDAQAQG